MNIEHLTVAAGTLIGAGGIVGSTLSIKFGTRRIAVPVEVEGLLAIQCSNVPTRAALLKLRASTSKCHGAL